MVVAIIESMALGKNGEEIKCKIVFWIGLFLLALAFNTQAAVQYYYKVFSAGAEIGAIIEKRHLTQDGLVEIQRQIALIKKHLLWQDEYQRETRLTYRQGVLQKLQHHIHQNNSYHWVQGVWVDDVFQLQTKAMKNLGDKSEDEELEVAAIATAAATIPYFDLVVGLLSSKPVDTDVVLKRVQFDGFLDDVLVNWSHVKNPQQTLTLLDSETQKLIRFQLKEGKSGVYRPNNQQCETPYRELIIEHEQGTYRYWLAMGELGEYVLRSEEQNQQGLRLVELQPVTDCVLRSSPSKHYASPK